MLSTSNYFEQTRSIDFSKLPETLRKSHELVKRVGTGGIPWDNYHASPQIKSMIDLYFVKLNEYLAQQKPKKKDSLTERYKDHPSDKARAARDRANQAPKPATAKPVQEGKPKKKAAKPATEGVKRKKVKKHGDQNTRLPVSHYPTDVAICRRFLVLTQKDGTDITRKQVKSLHQASERAIVERRVRKTDPHAKLFADMATAVGAVLKKMTDGRIETVEVVTFKDHSMVQRVRAVADAMQVRNSVGLLKRFINLQGTTPEVKTVKALLAAMEKEVEQHPNDANSSPIRAALAVLKDWKHGMPLKVTTQQLQGLNGLLGLGCPGTPAGADCGCSKKAGH